VHAGTGEVGRTPKAVRKGVQEATEATGTMRVSELSSFSTVTAVWAETLLASARKRARGSAEVRMVVAARGERVGGVEGGKEDPVVFLRLRRPRRS
jgi:hypothetical protein